MKYLCAISVQLGCLHLRTDLKAYVLSPTPISIVYQHANMSWNLLKYVLYIVGLVFLYLILMTYQVFVFPPQGIRSNTIAREELSSTKFGDKYLVNTEKCHIPNLNPWNSETIPLYIKKPYVQCSTKYNLTKIVYRPHDEVFLVIDEDVKSQYSTSELHCCYSNISRGKGELFDVQISVSPCTLFETQVKLSGTSVLVSCKTESGHEVYSNTHSLFEKKPDIPTKSNTNFADTEQPPNIFVIGIDSMSRLNFQRVMSSTANYLHEHEWLEYKGYNKIGDNTFPNLMALLTGKNITAVLKECDPQKYIDTCNFIWNDYSNLGYLTALMEDESSIGTFATYHFKGFRKQPTDLYYMPYIVASETLLPVKKMEGMTYCAGPLTSVERVLNVVKDLVLNYSDQRKFGVFWMNSVSHDDINAPGRVDEIFSNFLSELQSHINNNTIIIFLSDHGIRFGDIRLTRSGWLEERLPFLYFWIPNEFKRKFPKEYQHIRNNAVKLTTPYDVYIMLQHVLALYNPDYTLKESDGCPNCRSLFSHIDDRSCEEASIQFHWCTCFGYNYLNPKSELALLASNFAVNEINTFLDNEPRMSLKCSRFIVKSVISAGISVKNSYNKTFLLLIFETIPEAKYEITVSIYYSEKEWRFINEGSTSRLDRYEPTSSCVDENKMYCVCYASLLFSRRFFNTWFEI